MSVNFHFLNAGCGDCTIVHFPERQAGDKTKDERIMLVDLCTHEDDEAYEDVANYYRTHFANADGTIKPIFRFVCSHPHHDHIFGLKAFLAEKGITISNFWDLDHGFVPADFSGHDTHEDDWKAYKALGKASGGITVLQITRETKPGQFWDDSGDRITVLSPSVALVKQAHYKEDGTKRDADAVEIDEMSYALSIRINSRSVILAGDGRATPTWDDIYANCKDILPSCFVLKAGHHGQESSFHEEAVKKMAPLHIVFSNSEAEDKANGARKLYAKACPNATIWETWKGTVLVRVPFDADKPIEVSQD